MKIVLTGSLGHISKALARELLDQGHQVTVISTALLKKPEIEAMGAEAAIGTIDDVDFLTQTFTGADAVYTMLPPFPFFKNPEFDYKAYTAQVMNNFVQAIRRSGVKRVIHLSSIGAHLETGNGLLVFHHIAESVLKELPEDVALTFMRPVGFYYNLFEFIDPVKGKGFLDSFIGKILTIRYYGLIGFLQGKRGLILSNYGGDDRMPWVSPLDIAAAIADEFAMPAKGVKVRYVASEELSCQEIAGILGKAVGKPYLKWVTISDKQMLDALLAYKLPHSLASAITEMNASMHTGLLFEDYYRNRPKPGKVKVEDFAVEFSAKYNQA